jgi:hypothetical protein
MGVSNSAANVGNVLTAQAVDFDSELIPNLKGNTKAFLEPAQRRIQKLGTGINRQLFMYEELGADLTETTDGVIGSPEFVGQLTTPAQVGEWNNFGNFSAMVVAAAIDDPVGNSAIEGAYQAAQTISELYSETLDNGSSTDSSVNASSMLSADYATPLSLGNVRTMVNELISINVLPCKGDEFCGQISPNVKNDIYAGVSTTEQTLYDFYKYTKEGQAKFEEIATSTQQKEFVLPTTNVRFYVTPFVKQTSNYESTGSIGFRTYVEGNYSHIGIWLEVPGDTDLGDGDWRTISCGVVNDAPSSVVDPTATIGAWWWYRFHQTVVLPPGSGTGTQRYRYCDSVPAIQ